MISIKAIKVISNNSHFYSGFIPVKYLKQIQNSSENSSLHSNVIFMLNKNSLWKELIIPYSCLDEVSEFDNVSNFGQIIFDINDVSKNISVDLSSLHDDDLIPVSFQKGF